MSSFSNPSPFFSNGIYVNTAVLLTLKGLVLLIPSEKSVALFPLTTSENTRVHYNNHKCNCICLNCRCCSSCSARHQINTYCTTTSGLRGPLALAAHNRHVVASKQPSGKQGCQWADRAVRRTCKLRVNVIRSFSAKRRGSNFTNERKAKICGLDRVKKKKCLREKLKHNRWAAVGAPGVDFPEAVCLIRDSID